METLLGTSVSEGCAKDLSALLMKVRFNVKMMVFQ